MSRITLQIKEGESGEERDIRYALTVVSEDEYPRTVRGSMVFGEILDISKLVATLEEDEEEVPEIVDDGSDDEEEDDEEYGG